MQVACPRIQAQLKFLKSSRQLWNQRQIFCLRVSRYLKAYSAWHQKSTTWRCWLQRSYVASLGPRPFEQTVLNLQKLKWEVSSVKSTKFWALGVLVRLKNTAPKPVRRWIPSTFTSDQRSNDSIRKSSQEQWCMLDAQKNLGRSAAWRLHTVLTPKYM